MEKKSRFQSVAGMTIHKKSGEEITIPKDGGALRRTPPGSEDDASKRGNNKDK